MNLAYFLKISLIIVSIILSLFVLLQTGGAGLSSSLGGFGGGYYRSKRGLEKVLFVGTIVLSLLFVTISLLVLKFN